MFLLEKVVTEETAAMIFGNLFLDPRNENRKSVGAPTRLTPQSNTIIASIKAGP